jgi:T5SS/PEP-CTERM-associated repeat protein
VSAFHSLWRWAVCVQLAWPAAGQLVSDGQTRVINNATNAVTGDLTVGTNGSFTALILTNHGVVIHSGFGCIGLNSSARSNRVEITGSGSRWEGSNGLAVGRSGSFNRLLVAEGGVVWTTNAFCYIGNDSTSSNNVAVATGSNSIWSCANELHVGSAGDGNQLIVTNGGMVRNSQGQIGWDSLSTSNTAIVTGSGSLWTNFNGLDVGHGGAGNLLLITNGGTVESLYASLGFGAESTGNVALLTGTNSLLHTASGLFVGWFGAGNRLVVSDGAMVRSGDGTIGEESSGNNNTAVITGSGSAWSNTGSLYAGKNGAGSQLLVSNAATVFTSASLHVGFNATATNNVVRNDGGSIFVTGMLGLRRGRVQLNSGVIDVGLLSATCAEGELVFNSGTLNAGSSEVATGRALFVGDGTNTATLNLAGYDYDPHSFADGLTLRSNATLTGAGTIDGVVTVQAGAMLIPGAPLGDLIFNNPPVLQGLTAMDISKSGSALVNDHLQVTGTLTYGGALTVNKLGPDALSAGDQFILFTADEYAGAFSSVALPALGSGLAWTNLLAQDGSIAVVEAARPLQFNSLAVTGSQLLFSGSGGASNGTYRVLATTNAVLPMTQWTPVATNLFDDTGNFHFTNTITPGVPRRFYRLLFP